MGGAIGAWNAYQRGDSIALGFVSGSVTGFFDGGTRTFKFVKGYINSLIIQNSDSSINSVNHLQALISGIIDASGITGEAAKRLTKKLISQDLYKRGIKEIILFVTSEIEKDLSSNCR